ncbi:hypothetical protein M426DRAFT_126782 [Hypoxylon sp. CI-4A]|nr:hypothetical protein M426DRAFT_126782 [Hypoxylon sp. CI-4A]
MDASSSAPPPPPPTKARRRILSCNSCRRLKSRCEYDARVNSCQRCHKLRIHCSLQSVELAGVVPTSDSGEDQEANGKDRIANIESSLASVKESVDKISLFLQQNAVRTSYPLDGSSLGNTNQSPITELRSHHEQRVKTSNEAGRSAPIMMVRKFRSSQRRLYKDVGRDIVSQGIFDESVANKMVLEFILRLGHVIQFEPLGYPTHVASIRRSSPLLYAVCCLQALRFYKNTDLVNLYNHRCLYEEVRQMLGQVVLASPIPIEELYALLIMCTFEAAPEPPFEYLDSWHLSGICSQQAMSTIDFAKIMTNLNLGKFEAKDKTYLSLWNNICLIHLRFAAGTGKPITIPSDRLEQCSMILKYPQAAIEDEVVLAEILLHSELCNMDIPLLLDRQGGCPKLKAWEERWEHLLKSEKAFYLRLDREFAYVVVAMRSVEKWQSSSMNETTSQANQPTIYETPRTIHDDTSMLDSDSMSDPAAACAHKHALSMARIFLEMPAALIQELPKFHHISISYCTIILSECTDMSKSFREEVFEILEKVCDHCRLFSDELPAAMTTALEKVRRSLDGGNTLPNRDEQIQGLNRFASHGPGGLMDITDDQMTGMSNSMRQPNQHIAREDLGGEPGINPDLFDNDLNSWYSTVDKFFENWMNTGGA